NQHRHSPLKGFPSYLQQTGYHALKDQSLIFSNFLSIILEYYQEKASLIPGIGGVGKAGLCFHHNDHQLAAVKVQHKPHSMVQDQLPARKCKDSLSPHPFRYHKPALTYSLDLPNIVPM